MLVLGRRPPRAPAPIACLMTNLPPPIGPPLGTEGRYEPVAYAQPSHPPPQLKPPPEPHPTLPIGAAIGAIVVLTASLLVSKYVLDSIVGFEWPVVIYVSILALVGYGPSVLWCLFASRRWGTANLGTDIGLTPRWSDLGWGPVVWLGAVGIQIAVAAVVIGFGIPIANNTDGISELQVDRTYVISIVITAVVAAPIVEEMVFRGVVMRGLRSRLAATLTVFLQAVLFGAAHIDPVRGAGNLGLVMVLSGVGLALGIGAYLLRRIGPAIVAHAIFNSVILALVLTGVAERLQDVFKTPRPRSGNRPKPRLRRVFGRQDNQKPDANVVWQDTKGWQRGRGCRSAGRRPTSLRQRFGPFQHDVDLLTVL